MELKERKYTRYKYADYSSEGAYFITICTNERKRILSHINSVGDDVLDVPRIELTDYGKIVKAQIEKFNNTYTDICIDQYVIMPDHVHMIIIVYDCGGTSRTSSPTDKAYTRQHECVPQAISTFKRFINKKIGQNIWQRSYYDHVIRCKEDYEGVCKYIYENPIKWFHGEKEEEYIYKY